MAGIFDHVIKVNSYVADRRNNPVLVTAHTTAAQIRFNCGWQYFQPPIKEVDMSHHLDQNARDCIEACNYCAVECGICFAHMVGKESKNSCPACCIECAAICRLCVDAMARNSPFAKQICKLCADICDWCAAQCDAHDMDHCKSCAEACRKCAEACRKMAG